ncbi:PUTATIVE TWO-COMPONENT REGULATOR [Helicobacter bizzozeronii CCUG 35545]|nr:PUTATIVE TWO-COMPONENT REGULATOR [Helicobacter bizzozeronii CCUG 35545]
MGRAHKGRLFLLEDDPLLHHMVAEFLEQSGFEVRGAYDGDRALEILNQEVFDLWLLDIQVPGLDSFEALQILRQSHINTPAIFISVLKDMASLKKGFSSRG